MKVTQEQLNAPIKALTGEVINIKKDTALTLRDLLIESVLWIDESRKGADRITGVTFAEKVNTPMGELEFDEADVKLVETRMDGAPILTNNDYLYTCMQRFLHPVATPEPAEDVV